MMLLDKTSIERALEGYGTIKDALVKRIGHAVIRGWTAKRMEIAFEQLVMKDVGIEVGTIDGLIGPQTRHALELWQNRQRDVPTPSIPDQGNMQWPFEANVPRFFGPVGQNQLYYNPPYPVYLYDSRQKLDGFSLHRKVVPSVDRVLNKVKEHYGVEKIHALHLDRFFGSLNVRRKRGGTTWSMHSWGIAIDWDANRNQLRMTAAEAVFAKPIYNAWWKAWEEEGWVSLGRRLNYDWMHVQAALI